MIAFSDGLAACKRMALVKRTSKGKCPTALDVKVGWGGERERDGVTDCEVSPQASVQILYKARYTYIEK